MFHSIIEELFSLADLLGAAADGVENAAKRLDKKILDLKLQYIAEHQPLPLKRLTTKCLC